MPRKTIEIKSSYFFFRVQLLLAVEVFAATDGLRQLSRLDGLVFDATTNVVQPRPTRKRRIQVLLSWELNFSSCNVKLLNKIYKNKPVLKRQWRCKLGLEYKT